ncbi:hypothetical protein ACFZCY_29295 [Streptomyces sp. NPDC007983]|uniref:hypothetical protein n=1 Tax=Streptomyces sp. NPDC007983 TaxID=3364800 RepID=UPI0036E5A240
MTEASIPPQPTRSLPDTAGSLPDGGEAAGGGPPAVPDSDPDDLVIEDLTDAAWPTVAPRICICTFSGE